jgi:hypothetical protein
MVLLQQVYLNLCCILTMQVRDVHFPKERTSRRRRHFCFVTFESMQVCQTCVLPQNPCPNLLRECGTDRICLEFAAQ